MCHPIAFAGLLPHPPIVVPAVGRTRAADCRATTRACEALARRLVDHAPRRLVLVSPHAPRRGGAFGVWSGRRLTGDLKEFGAVVAVDLPNDHDFANALVGAAGDEGLPTWWIDAARLDHGAVVPLSFLARAGWRGPTCVTSLPWHTSEDELRRFGAALAHAARDRPGVTALVASGDMSHRLQPDSPSGYDPLAGAFDTAAREAVEAGRLDALVTLDPALREAAGEDVVDPCAIAVAALPAAREGVELLSYEAPFGVGYMVAVLHDATGAGV